MITDLVSARLGCSPRVLIEALGEIVENAVKENGAFQPDGHSEQDT